MLINCKSQYFKASNDDCSAYKLYFLGFFKPVYVSRNFDFDDNFQHLNFNKKSVMYQADLISFHDLEVKFEGPESNKAFALKEKK